VTALSGAAVELLAAVEASNVWADSGAILMATGRGSKKVTTRMWHLERRGLVNPHGRSVKDAHGYHSYYVATLTEAGRAALASARETS
jgi:hypothetical protein